MTWGIQMGSKGWEDAQIVLESWSDSDLLEAVAHGRADLAFDNEWFEEVLRSLNPEEAMGLLRDFGVFHGEGKDKFLALVSSTRDDLDDYHHRTAELQVVVKPHPKDVPNKDFHDLLVHPLTQGTVAFVDCEDDQVSNPDLEFFGVCDMLRDSWQGARTPEKYDQMVKDMGTSFERLPHDVLVQEALDLIQHWNSCSNGGHELYIDREGYYTVRMADADNLRQEL